MNCSSDLVYCMNFVSADDVLKHVQESNDKAAATVKEEMVRERQNTARRLRKYYMRCLDKVLNSDGSR